jgi:hypothetical protein
MREVSPGDAIFSFLDTLIPAIGIAQSHCYEAPKPDEFGATGSNWSDIGWKVEVRYFELQNKIRPGDEMTLLMPLLPDRYSPLQKTGRGNQGVYLTSVQPNLALALISLIGFEAKTLINGNYVEEHDAIDQSVPDILRWEDHLVEEIKAKPELPETEREALVMARRGQGMFKRNVQLFESRCRLTGVDKIEHLIASHCKPWRDCESPLERLDGENGLLLTPNADHLFDRGFISFESNGELLVSPVAHKESLSRMGVPIDKVHNVGAFSDGQKQYLEYHRENLFLVANI